MTLPHQKVASNTNMDGKYHGHLVVLLNSSDVKPPENKEKEVKELVLS